MTYLSLVRLRRDASIAALAPLLLGTKGKGGTSRQPGHHLVWSLFADRPDRQRDFLWREMRKGEFLTLSARQPEDRHGLFEITEPKSFSPLLEPGDRLGFSLRANPVVRRRHPKRRRSVKHDVVMDALKSCKKGERAARRCAAIEETGFAWLERQGRKAGFTVRSDTVCVDGYDRHRVSRQESSPMLFSTLDFDGIIIVDDPDALLSAIINGFGASRAYGCGLMLIRRA